MDGIEREEKKCIECSEGFFTVARHQEREQLELRFLFGYWMSCERLAVV
jgi:hypothetical protein